MSSSSPPDEKPPWQVEFEMFCCHLASELKVDEISAPLRKSLDLLCMVVATKTRAQHEHPTPLVHVNDHDVTASDASGEQAGNELPTLPPGVDYDREVPTRRTRSITKSYARSDD